jgi:Tfp pilus assembly protein PilW
MPHGDPDSLADSKSIPHTQSDSESDAVSDSEPHSEPDSLADANTVAEPEPVSNSESITKSESDAFTDSEPDSLTHPDAASQGARLAGQEGLFGWIAQVA